MLITSDNADQLEALAYLPVMKTRPDIQRILTAHIDEAFKVKNMRIASGAPIKKSNFIDVDSINYKLEMENQR